MSGHRCRLAGLWILAVAGCGSPPAPPGIPEAAEPPPPAADACPPVGSAFGNSAFFFMDDLGPASCLVYLEQDECVLGIFEDCTVPEASARQWEGRLVPELADNTIELRSASVGSSNAMQGLRCEGPLVQDELPPRSQLSCGDRHLTLERSEPERPPFGAVAASLRMSPDAMWIEDMIVFDGQGQEQVWAVVDAGVGSGGGLFIQRRAAGASWQRVDADFGGTIVNYPALNALARMPDDDKVIVTGQTGLLRVDAATAVVEEILETTENVGYYGVTPLAPNEFLALRAELGAGAFLERWTIEPFAKVADEAHLDNVGVSKMFTGTSTEPIVIAGRGGDNAVEAYVFERDDLSTPASEQSLVVNYAGGVFVTGRGAMAVLHHKGARIFELGAERPERWLPVPYFEIHSAIGYDPDEDTIFVAGSVHGRGPGIARYDRASAWAHSDLVLTDSLPALLRSHRGTLYATVGGYVLEIPWRR